jgi:hypothetical protein
MAIGTVVVVTRDQSRADPARPEGMPRGQFDIGPLGKAQRGRSMHPLRADLVAHLRQNDVRGMDQRLGMLRLAP